MKTKLLTLLTLAFIGLNTANAQVGIGTTNPHPSAILEVDVSSLTDKQGFLPPRMSETERDDNITNNATNPPAVGLTIYNTDANCVEFWGGYGWTSLCADVEAGDVLNSQTGKIWMDRNLGANQVAQSFDDPAAYGDLYQWGRAADGHEKIFRVAGDDPTSGTYTTVETGSDGVGNFNASGNAWDGEFITRNSGVNNWVDPSVPGVDNLWQGVNGTNNPCPAGFRLPTEAELETERETWATNDRAGAFGSPLKLPIGGGRNSITGVAPDPVLVDRGILWSSTIDGDNAKVLVYRENNALMNSLPRSVGRSVRCIKGE